MTNTNSYIISTERLGLREWTDSDIEPFSKLNADEEVMEFFPGTSSYLETAKMVERISSHFKKNGFGLFAVEHKATGKFIGFTGLAVPRFESFFTPCVEIGWRYDKEYWGHGLASEAALACLNYGFNTLKLDKIVSFTAAVNIRSIKVMQRIGLSYVAEFDHPLISNESLLCKHVLYEITMQHYLDSFSGKFY